MHSNPPQQRLAITRSVSAPIPAGERRNGWLYATFIALITFVSNGTSTHLPEFIASVGLPIALGMLWGLGRTGARAIEVMAGARSTRSPLRALPPSRCRSAFFLG